MQRLKRENLDSNLTKLEANSRILAGVGLFMILLSSVLIFNWGLEVNLSLFVVSAYMIYSAGVKKCFIYDILGIESPLSRCNRD